MSTPETGLTHSIGDHLVVSCALALTNNHGRYVLGRRSGGSNPLTANKWGLPGGKVDSGETIVAAAMRETVEEMGVQPKVTSEPVLHTLRRIEDGHHAGKLFVGLVVAGEFATDDVPMPSPEMSHVLEMSFEDVCRLGVDCSPDTLAALVALGDQPEAFPVQDHDMLPVPTPPAGRDFRGVTSFEANFFQMTE